MKILQQITQGDITLVFTENPEQDIIKIVEMYEDDERDCYMGYETPELTNFNFLGKEYPCISFWHDNEDPQEIEFKEN